ncbi:hypothetical protein J6590_027710 [Homalodisca vitripennis]|nr:hypothetical protein J6590_027710 [Homalodisca vitripennis]
MTSATIGAEEDDCQSLFLSYLTRSDEHSLFHNYSISAAAAATADSSRLFAVMLIIALDDRPWPTYRLHCVNVNSSIRYTIAAHALHLYHHIHQHRHRLARVKVKDVFCVSGVRREDGGAPWRDRAERERPDCAVWRGRRMSAERRIASAEGRAGTCSIYEGGSVLRSQNITFCSTSIKIMSGNEFLTDPTISSRRYLQSWICNPAESSPTHGTGVS